MSDEFILDFWNPETNLDKVFDKVLINTNEFSSQNSSGVYISSEWLETFIVSQNLGSGSSRHWSHEKGVSCSVFHDIFLQFSPIVSIGRWLDVPKIELKLTFTQR